MDITLGHSSYRLVAIERNGQWTAHAERVDTGERFGIEATGQSAPDATEGLIAWLEWQFEHTQALEALQQAERAYHRALADAAFAPTLALQAEGRASLEAVDAARGRLDAVRLRRPNV